MGIKSDHKFVRLINRLLYEHAQVRDSVQAISNLEKSNLLSGNLSDILSNKNKEMKEQSETTLKHIFKYIDRYAERKVLEDRTKQPLVMNKLDKLKEEPRVSIRYFAPPRVEMMRLTSEGYFHINEDYYTDDCVFKNIERAVFEEIIKINPVVSLILGFRVEVTEFLRPGSLIQISLHIYNDRICCLNPHIKSLNIRTIAKYFSDEIKKHASE